MKNVDLATWMSVLTWFNLSEIKVTNKVKVTPRSRLFPRSNYKCLNFYQQVGSGPSTERRSCFVFFCSEIPIVPIETSVVDPHGDTPGTHPPAKVATLGVCAPF